jgi:hypothetical protein
LKDRLRVIPTPLSAHESAHESQAGAIGFDWAPTLRAPTLVPQLFFLFIN